MADPLRGRPPYSSMPTGSDQITSDPTSTSNIPISDFRRNEARPIIADDGKRLLCVPLTSPRDMLQFVQIDINRYITSQVYQRIIRANNDGRNAIDAYEHRWNRRKCLSEESQRRIPMTRPISVRQRERENERRRG